VRYDYAAGERGKIVIVDPDRLLGERLAGTEKRPQEFAFFRVDAQDGIRRIQEHVPVEGDGFELVVSVAAGTHSHGLEGLASAQLQLVEVTVHRVIYTPPGSE
jgi:hypothetical protein